MGRACVSATQFEAMRSNGQRLKGPCGTLRCIGCPASVAGTRWRLGPAHDQLEPVYSRNASGLTRIAAPVGQARTHAGPPERSLHMSHLTAFFA
jgi:hypothetical protein